MKQNNKLVLIFGPMCSGKSTVINLFKKRHPDFFHASMDNIKWFISDYSTEKYAKSGIVNRILFAMNKQAIQENLSVIVEGNIGLMFFSEQYEKIAKENNVDLIKINIETSYDKIVTRFNERVEEAKNKNEKLSIYSESILKKRFDEYQKSKDNNLATLDSGLLSPEELLEKLESVIAGS